jgi:UDP-4-amino-4,6-dideoxy-N-acetyl-beta-L-altrosamine N-acetyltransferase
VNESVSSTVTVRPLKSSDADAVLAWRNHPDVRNFMYTTHEITRDEHARWIKMALSENKIHARIVEADRLPIGVVTFKPVYDGRVADWGFYNVPGSPKGTGMTMGYAALAHAFEALGFRKVCGQALSFNQRSRGFHLRLGFVEEGRLKNQFAGEGNVTDVVLFGLLKSEFGRRL